MARTRLPDHLGTAFSVAAAFDAGVSPGRLRSRDLERPFHGMRAVVGGELIADAVVDATRAYPRSIAAQHIHRRATEYATVMARGAFFSHLTAAALWDAPLPRRILEAVDANVIEVSVFWPASAPRSAGVRGHAVRAELASVREHPVSRLRVASPRRRGRCSAKRCGTRTTSSQ